jgi:hypothetical protein
MLTKSFTAANDDSYLARFCHVARQATDTNRVISTIEGVITPGICLCVDSVQAPYPVYSIPLLTTHLRKEFPMCPKEKAAVAAAAHVPEIGQICLHHHPTTNISGWQGFWNIFSNKHPFSPARSSPKAF